MTVHGRIFEPAEALRIGLVDEIRPLAEVKDRAVEAARALGDLPAPAYKETKRRLRGASAEAGLAGLQAELDQFFGSFRSLVRR